MTPMEQYVASLGAGRPTPLDPVALTAEMNRLSMSLDHYGMDDVIDESRNQMIEDHARANLGMPRIPYNAQGLRTDGPTVEQWVKAGYWAEHYPPEGYVATLIPCRMDRE